MPKQTPPAAAAAAITTPAQAPKEPGCWHEKAAYDQCFDKWYKDVFLLQKAHGRVGCEKEYEVYSACFLSELDKDQVLVEGIKSVMQPEVKQRFAAQEAKRQQHKDSSPPAK